MKHKSFNLFSTNFTQS